MSYLNRNFANHRGLIRTALADLMWRIGPYRKYGRVDWSRVSRMVFICQGNICRSPFAYFQALALESKFPIESFGLATTTGSGANGLAIEVALDFGLDMSGHSATDMSDFEICDGDLLIVMEDRHITWLGPNTAGRDVQLCLLGLWCRPRFALLYDPHNHPRAYFESCFHRINLAVANLLKERSDTQGSGV
jgi:protein-tyrosine phosphatase